jgi:hypothetical protein
MRPACRESQLAEGLSPMTTIPRMPRSPQRGRRAQRQRRPSPGAHSVLKYQPEPGLLQAPSGAGGFIAIEVAVGGRRSSRANAVHQIIAGPQVGVGTVALARCRRGNRRHLCSRRSRTRPVKAAPAAAMAVSALTILCLTREYPFLSTSRPSEFPRSSHSSSTCILCQLTASGLLHADGKI